MQLILSILLTLPVLLPAQESPADSRPIQSRTFAVVNGQTITRGEFAQWLLDTHGFRHAEDFTILILFRQEASRLGIELEPGALERSFERHWHDQVLLRYGGDEQRFLVELGREGIDKQGYRRRQWGSMEMQELGRRISVATRKPHQKQLRNLYGRLFPTGERIHLRVAFFNRFRDFKEQRTPSETILKELDAAARQRAEEFIEAVRQAPDRFPDLVREQSDLLQIKRYDNYVRDLRDSGGDLPYYNRTLFRGALEPMLKDKPDAGVLVGPSFGSGGFYVLQVLESRLVTYDEVAGEVLKQYMQNEVTGAEIYALRLKLLEQASIDPPLPKN